MQKAEFGDFQTPPSLANDVCSLIKAIGCTPSSILEPTCGEGNFLLAALDSFDTVIDARGYDINLTYVHLLREKLLDYSVASVDQADFFKANWKVILDDLPDPLLVIGNPPWVTNSELTSLDSTNLPAKQNFKNHTGWEAITGASNFDISEWMLIRMLEWVRDRKAMVAMLCKTAVARKVLLHEWKKYPDAGHAKMFMIDAPKDFGASVEACLFVYDTHQSGVSKVCGVYSELSLDSQVTSFGFEENQLIANIHYFRKWKHVVKNSDDENFIWRSGIKHDCSSVMELTREDGRFMNKLGEAVEIEDTYVFPMMKSSHVANSSNVSLDRFMIVTQKFVGQETQSIRLHAPKTWKYLSEHQQFFDRRKSAIYKNRPQFSIFGIGDYSFAPWKVAISGLYKKLYFVVIGPKHGKPVVLDDTCYFLPCQEEGDAQLLAELLNSDPAKEFFSSFIFWDAKRPITAKVLRKLNLVALARDFHGEDRNDDVAYRSLFVRPE